MRLDIPQFPASLPFVRVTVILMGLLLALGASVARGDSFVNPVDETASVRSRLSPDGERPGTKSRSTSTPVAEGMFVGKEEHQASGSYQIEESEGGDLTLTFSEDFEVTQGPDLYVFLSPEEVGNLTNDNATGAGALRVDTLHSSEGQQDYDLNDTINLDDYNSVVIYCVEFSALFAGAELDTSIPVELTAFDGSIEGDAVHLTWKTASEQNNAGFRVQRRRANAETSSWTQVDFVAGAGTTSQPQFYDCKDVSLPYEADGLTYRLKQVDTDGTTHLSEKVTLFRRSPNALRLKAPYPNPSSSRITVQYEVAQSRAGTGIRLVLYDATGRQVKVRRVTGAPGRHEHRLTTRDLASGAYVLRLVAGSTAQSRRLTVVR